MHKFAKPNYIKKVDEEHFEVIAPVLVSPQFFGGEFSALVADKLSMEHSAQKEHNCWE